MYCMYVYGSSNLEIPGGGSFFVLCSVVSRPPPLLGPEPEERSHQVPDPVLLRGPRVAVVWLSVHLLEEEADLVADLALEALDEVAQVVQVTVVAAAAFLMGERKCGL